MQFYTTCYAVITHFAFRILPIAHSFAQEEYAMKRQHEWIINNLYAHGFWADKEVDLVFIPTTINDLHKWALRLSPLAQADKSSLCSSLQPVDTESRPPSATASHSSISVYVFD